MNGTILLRGSLLPEDQCSQEIHTPRVTALFPDDCSSTILLGAVPQRAHRGRHFGFLEAQWGHHLKKIQPGTPVLADKTSKLLWILGASGEDMFSFPSLLFVAAGYLA